MSAPLFLSTSGRIGLYATPFGPRLTIFGDGYWLADYPDQDDARRLALALTALADSFTAAAALGAAAAVDDTIDPYPYLLNVDELEDVPLEQCENCPRLVRRDRLYHAWDEVGQRTIWVGYGCARKLARETRGGVQLAITSHPYGAMP